MSTYPPQISERLRRLPPATHRQSPNATGTAANFDCGSVVRFHLEIDTESKVVKSVGFRSNGCGFMLAAADAISEIIEGKRLGELHGVDDAEIKSEVRKALGGIHENRNCCINACVDALKAAFADFRALQIEEYCGQSGVVCTCFGISEKAVEDLIAEACTKTVDDVTRLSNAGGGCGSCRMLIQEMIDSAGSEYS